MEFPKTSNLSQVQLAHKLYPFPYIVVGSGMGGGTLARKLVQDGKRVLLIEKGGLQYSTHWLNTSRPHFDFKSDDPSTPARDNEVLYQMVRKPYPVTEDSTSEFGGGAVNSLGGRSLAWSLETPGIDKDRAECFFPRPIIEYLYGKEKGYEKAQKIMTNSPPSDSHYPTQQIERVEADKKAVNKAKGLLEGALNDYYRTSEKDKTTEYSPSAVDNGAEYTDGTRLYYFPQGAYSTVDYLLDRLYARDENLTVLSNAEVVSLTLAKSDHGSDPQPPSNDKPPSDDKPPSVLHPSSNPKKSIPCPPKTTAKEPTNLAKSPAEVQEIVFGGQDWSDGTSVLPTAGSHVILCAGTIETAAIALRSGLNPQKFYARNFIGCGLTDHEIWSTRFWKESSNEESANGPVDRPVELCTRMKVNGKNAKLTICTHAERFYSHNFTTGSPPTSPKTYGPNVLNVMLEFESELDEESSVKIDPLTTETRLTLKRQPMDDSDSFRKNLRALTEKLYQYFEYEGSSMPDPVIGKFGFVAHEVGTMRIGGPRGGWYRGVVDENLQVHDVGNLFVCDLSVFPYSPMANPSLTLTALAIRLGDYLASHKPEVSHRLEMSMTSFHKGKVF